MKKTLQEEIDRIKSMIGDMRFVEEETTPDVVPEIPSEIREGNAFSGAAAKAKEEGKDAFEFEGKTYNVK